MKIKSIIFIALFLLISAEAWAGNPFEEKSSVGASGVSISETKDVGEIPVPPPEKDYDESPSGTFDKRKHIPNEDFLIIGHMGAPHEEPENTLESFQKALDLGANAIETDVSLTKDGYLVHWHDWDPDHFIANYRQIGKQGLKVRPYCPEIWKSARRPVPELTLADFRANYGYALRKRGLGTKKKLPNKIPTFQEFLRWAAGKDELKKILIDVKIPKGQTKYVDPYFKRAIKMLKKYDLMDRAIFLIPNDDILQKALFYRKTYGIQISYDQELPGILIIRPKKFSAVTKSIKHELNWSSIGRPVATLLGYSIYKKIIKYDQKLKRIHNFKQPSEPIDGIIAWTLNDRKEIKEIISLGVNGIVTDRPDVLKKVVEQMVSSQKVAGKVEGATRPTAGDEPCEFTSRGEGGRVPPFIEK